MVHVQIILGFVFAHDLCRPLFCAWTWVYTMLCSWTSIITIDVALFISLVFLWHEEIDNRYKVIPLQHLQPLKLRHPFEANTSTPGAVLVTLHAHLCLGTCLGLGTATDTAQQVMVMVKNEQIHGCYKGQKGVKPAKPLHEGTAGCQDAVWIQPTHS